MTTCSKCQAKNRETARFCKRCGSQFAGIIDKILQDVVGKEEILHQLTEMVNVYNLCRKNSQTQRRPEMDMLVLGSTGTGKTYLANAVQDLFFSRGVVSNPKIIRIDAPDFEDWLSNFTPDELKKYRGSLLFIDNVHLLMTETTSLTSVDKLLSMMEDWERDLNADWEAYPIVIFAGEKNIIEEYFRTKQNGRNRFGHTFILNDYSAGELKKLCKRELSKYSLTISSAAEERLLGYFRSLIRNRSVEFRNAFEAVRKCDDIYRICLKKGNVTIVEPDDITGEIFREQTPEEILERLDSFVGIENIKKEVRGWVENIRQYRQEKCDPEAIPPFRDQFIFLGNPGTGKTTIARIFADILNALNILPNGQLIEVSRADLVDEYIGGTAPKTMKVVESAMGGVLFIDEAYTLATGGSSDFGKEAINTLLKPVEEKRGRFVCILAGYTKEMQELVNSNPGITSRFNKTLEFHDYKPEELTEIFLSLAKRESYTLDEETMDRVPKFFEKMYKTRTKNFGNARNVVNAFNNAIERHRQRLSDNKLPHNKILSRVDIEGAGEMKELNIDDIMLSLDREFIGMQAVKKFIKEIAIQKADMDDRLEMGLNTQQTIKLNIILTGNPGTGKTTMARKLGEIFYSMKILPSSDVIERERKDIVGKYSDSAGEEMGKACDLAMGKLLFIDEAYAFAPVNDTGTKDEEASKAIEVLMKRMEDDAGKFAVVLAGYPAPMDNFIRVNDGIARRITHRINIDDYSVVELIQIFKQMATRQEYLLADDTEPQLFRKVTEMLHSKDKTWGNAGEMTKLLEATKTRLADRVRNMPKEERKAEFYQTILPGDIPFDAPKKLSAGEAMGKLNELTGLENIKTQIAQMVASFRSDEERAKLTGEVTVRQAPHYIFMGNPGTGKTTVAKLMADILTSLGVLSRGHIVEATEKDLVAGVVGQTVIKTSNVIDSALGGVLFIDEAYSLNKGDISAGANFGQEAINALLERLTRDAGKFVCVLAGYSREMKEFLNTNSGLERRFRKIEFEDYKPDELEKIFRNLMAKENMNLNDDAERNLASFFKKVYETRNPSTFGNGGTVVNIYKLAKERQGTRLMPLLTAGSCSSGDLHTLTIEDITGEDNDRNTPANELMKEFDNLVGGRCAKKKMMLVLNQISLNRKRAEVTGRPFINLNSCFVFTGSSETGQREFAEALARVFKKIGISQQENVKETSFEKLIDSIMYNSLKAVDNEWSIAEGGTLLLTNISALAGVSSPLGLETALINKIKEDKGRTVCIICATENEWGQFQNSFPKLAFCFKDQFIFDDYSPDELAELFVRYVARNAMRLTDDARVALTDYFTSHNKNGSAEIEWLYNSAIYQQNNRLAVLTEYPPDLLTVIEASDIIK